MSQAQPGSRSPRGLNVLPVVVVYMYKGRSLDQKRGLVAAITQAMADHASATPDNVIVQIRELERENWAMGGQLGIDMEDT
jgi:4-oxalocrotonate tautomerase